MNDRITGQGDDSGRWLEPVAPAGWRIRPSANRHWWLYRSDRWVAEFGVLGTGEWWVCPTGEVLPWGTTFATAAAAIDAVVTWWMVTRPFD